MFEEYAETALCAGPNAVEQVPVPARLVELGQKAKKRGEGRGEGRGEELLKRSVRKCVALVENVKVKMKKQARYKKEEEKMFETVLRSGLDVEGLIEAEEEEERRKSSVKGASAQAFNERGVLSQDKSTYQNDGSEGDLSLRFE